MDELFDYVNSIKNEKCFINCAAVVLTKYFYEPDSTFQTNVIAMKDTLERCISNKFSRYINCSTSDVYSMRSWIEGGTKEDAMLLASPEQSLRTSYAAGKLMTEFFMKDAVETGKFKGCSLRFANVYSSDEIKNGHIIPHIISSIQKENKVVLLENAKETRRTFLNNHDSCMAVIKLLENEDSLDDGIYNVGTKEEIYIIDLVKLISKLLNKTDVVIEFKGMRTADPPRRLLNFSKLEHCVNWVPEVSLKQGLKECIKKRLNREY